MPAKRLPSWRINWSKFFGYDYFISFKLGPYPQGAQSYASDLARRLREADFTVFFSEEEAPPGEELTPTLMRALNASRVLVVIATETSLLHSPWVRKEVELFRQRHPGRPVVPINIDNAIGKFGERANAPQWLGGGDHIWLDDSDEAAKEGIASPGVVTRLAVTSRFIKGNTRFRLAAMLLAAVLVSITTAAVMAEHRTKQELRNEAMLRIADDGRAMTSGDQAGGTYRGLMQVIAAYRSFPSSTLEAILMKEGIDNWALLHLITKVDATPCAESGLIRTVAFSPNGKQIVSGSYEGDLNLWDANGKCLCMLQTGHSNGVKVAYNQDNIHIVAGYGDGTLWILNGVSGQTIQLLPDQEQQIQGHVNGVTSIAYNPRGNRIVAGFADGRLILYDADKKSIIKPWKAHSNDVLSVAFSPDGRRLVSGGRDSVLRIWDANGRFVRTLSKEGSGGVTSVAYNRLDGRIVSGNNDGTICIWNPDGALYLKLRGQDSDGVMSVTFSPDGTKVISAGKDKTLHVWNAFSGAPLESPYKGHTDVIYAVAYSSDGSRIVSGGDDGTLRIWDTTKIGRAIGYSRLMSGYKNDAAIMSIAFSQDGTQVIYAGRNESLRVLSLDSGSSKAVNRSDNDLIESTITSIAFSPCKGDNRILLGNEDGTLGIWKWIADNTKIQKIKAPEPWKGHLKSVIGVAFISPDCKSILSGSTDNTLNIWNAANGQREDKQLVYRKGVESIAFSPDGSRTIYGMDADPDYSLHIWDISNKQSVGSPLNGHSDAVTSIAFSPDGSHVVSGSREKKLRIWDAKTGQQIGPAIESGNETVWSIAVSPDGKHFVDGGNPTIMIFPISSGWIDELCAKLERNPSLEEWKEWIDPNIPYTKATVPCPSLPAPVLQDASLIGKAKVFFSMWF